MLQADPGFVALLEQTPFPTIDVTTLAQARANRLAMVVPLSDGVERTDHVVPGDPEVPGDADVTVRVHRPKGVEGPLPCVYSIHGGGYVLGSYTMDDARFDVWCQRHRIVGVSVEYRLAPETPYPGPLDDCYAGLRWVHRHAAELGIDPDNIGIAGTSAGGGLAAAVALLARDRGEVPLRFQLLDCPMLDDRQITPSSRLDGLLIWSRESNEFGWRSYLGALYGTDDVPAYAAPARATDLRGLPPAYVCVGNVDGFRDEDIDYAVRLNQAGVPTELHVHPGAPHGVGFAPDLDVAKRYLRGIDSWLARQVQR